MVTFVDESSAKVAVETLNKQTLNDRIVHVRYDHKAESGDDIHRVFVGGLPWTIDEAMLYDHVKAIPPHSLHIITNMSGRSRGFAILMYRRLEDAEAAISAFNQTEIESRKLEVNYFHKNLNYVLLML